MNDRQVRALEAVVRHLSTEYTEVTETSSEAIEGCEDVAVTVRTEPRLPKDRALGFFEGAYEFRIGPRGGVYQLDGDGARARRATPRDLRRTWLG